MTDELGNTHPTVLFRPRKIGTTKFFDSIFRTFSEKPMVINGFSAAS